VSREFVRYTPETETIDPHIDELLEQIVDFRLSPFVTVGRPCRCGSPRARRRVRRIHRGSARVRRSPNHQPRTEPTSADPVLPHQPTAIERTTRP